MPTLTELQEKRGRLVTQAREALNAITSNTDDARATELEQRHDLIMKDFDKVEIDIKREERMAQIENQEEERRERQRPRGDDREVRGQDGNEGGERGPRGQDGGQPEYRGAFDAYLRSGCDITACTTEQRELLRRGYSEARTQVAGTAQAGGYTVPVELAREIVKTMKDWGPMYDGDLVREIVTGSGNEFDIPTNDDTDNDSTGSKAEADDLKDDNSGDLTFGQKRLDAFVDATPWIKISFELMQDSVFDIEGFVAEAIGERSGRKANRRLTVGTGNNEPNGIVTASTQGLLAASALGIAPDELLTLQHSVRAPYRRSPKCRWMFADTTLLAIRKLKDGQGNFLWQMGDIRAGAPNTLLEKPYSINDDVPTIGAGARAVIFGDLGRYWVRKVGSPLIGTVRERFWPKIGLAGLLRYDGELSDGQAVKHLKMAA
ncbi:phage major capsid protein [Sphingomonas sanguinis]|uniref:phage major capsid protein n=1 Tax=Sphingomonas sanguinis TaxID=33051 RepID=UPI001C583050|nr:phage major capsid protein [Sphingomonas sanguinis]QXT34331.1 phage major capsid protein [Sphingomonas sanguinis]